MRRWLLLVAVLVGVQVTPTAGAATPTAPAGCAPYLARPSVAPITSYDTRGRRRTPRVFAIQFKQSPSYVVSYGAFRSKVECVLRTYVLPYRAKGRPNVVVFDEDVGLATIATGSRGLLARDVFAGRGAPGCEPQGVPCGTLGALALLTASYAGPLASYQLRFPLMTGLDQGFVAATDTIVRSFLATFSALAKKYGIYLIGSADLAPFTQSSSAVDRALFADPDLRSAPSSVYVATAPTVYNQVFVWGPHDARSTGPDVLRNVVATNRKVPLTPIENELGLTPGPSSGAAGVENLEPYSLPGTKARLGLATSLPAFIYGSPPAGLDPCSDIAAYYMRCLDRLGANLVIQDDANPGRWTGPDGAEQWQPMSWLASTYRAVSDPTVGFDYNVTSMMVGNLADLAFDGQSAITQRGLRGAGCHYIGNAAFVGSEDQAQFRAYAGNRPSFLTLAPWVVPDGSRAALRRVGAALAPGSRAAAEDDYLETALIADLPFPPDPRRHDCATAVAPGVG